MKKQFAAIAISAAVAAGLSPTLRADELYRPVQANATANLRADADDARRSEADLARRVADQERANADLREQLRRAGTRGVDADLAAASADAAALRKRVAEQRIRRDVARDKYDAARRDAMVRLDDSPAMRDARRAIDQAGAKLEQVAGPIVERLSENEDYQELQAMVDAAAQAGQALQGFDNVEPRTQATADDAFD